MIGITTNFSNILGRIKQLPIQQQIRRRTVKAGNKDSKREYQAIAKERKKQQITNNKITMEKQILKLYNEAKQMGRKGTQKQKQKLLKLMNETMEKVVKELLAIENTLLSNTTKSTHHTYRGGKHKSHLWSDTMAKKTKLLN